MKMSKKKYCVLYEFLELAIEKTYEQPCNTFSSFFNLF